jgi:hypothetical protein
MLPSVSLSPASSVSLVRSVEFTDSMLVVFCFRGTIGANSVLGDKRWAGTYGVDADYWAEDNCRVLYILTSDILVRKGRFLHMLLQ